MPAKSKAQQRLMGMAHAIQKGEMPASKSPAAAKVARTMKPGDVEEFAATKLKGLPNRKNSKGKPKSNPKPKLAKPPLPKAGTAMPVESGLSPNLGPLPGPPPPPAPQPPPRGRKTSMNTIMNRILTRRKAR